MVKKAVYTSIDLNTADTTSLYSPTVGDGTAMGVYMENGGTTAEVELQATDGSSTATLAVPGAGNDLTFEGVCPLSTSDTLQIEVTTKKGSSQNNTAVVFVEDD